MIRHYSRWAGNEEGVHEDPKRCVVPVSGFGWWQTFQCSRKKIGDTLYCKQHQDPKFHGWIPKETECKGRKR